MPYTAHPACNLPEDSSEKTWRYMDFTKFVSLLEERALFFPRPSSLTDPFEGFLSKPTIEMFKSMPHGLTPTERRRREEIANHNLRVMRSGREILFVSSWHLNAYESCAMWQLYLRSGEGVAIQSTIQRMIDAFRDTPDAVQLGTVKYVDYNEEQIPWNNTFYLALHKRRSFEHERELRAIVMRPEIVAGITIPVSLDTLISRVYVAPNSPIWIHELVKKM